MEGSAACKTFAVALNAQGSGFAVIPEKRIAGMFVQRSQQPETLSLTEIAVALSVTDAGLFRVIDKVIVTVLLQLIMVQQRFREVPHPAGIILSAEFRAVSPCLVTVHKDFFLRNRRKLHHSGNLAQGSLGQTLYDNVGTVSQFVSAADRGNVFPELYLVTEFGGYGVDSDHLL